MKFDKFVHTVEASEITMTLAYTYISNNIHVDSNDI